MKTQVKLPIAVRNSSFCGSSDTEARSYILDQMRFFGAIQHKATDEVGWLAFKLGCTRSQAAAAISWAREKTRAAG